MVRAPLAGSTPAARRRRGGCPSVTPSGKRGAGLGANMQQLLRVGTAWSCKQRLDHGRGNHPGELLIEALEAEGELLVVDAEAVEHRGVQVADVDGVDGDVVAEIVG